MKSEPGQLRYCAYCGLPAGTSRAELAEPVYCCFGCRFAARVSGGGREAGQSRTALIRLGVAVFFAMNVMVFSMALWSADIYPIAAGDGPGQRALFELFRHLSLLFSIPVLILLGVPLAQGAWSEALQGRPGSDLLLVAGVAASWVYSVVSLNTGGSHIYFEVACAVLVAVTLGKWLEAEGKLRTTQSLQSLSRLLPERVCVLTDHGAQMCRLDEVRPGDRIRVLAGGRIPADGLVLERAALVDEQLLTGESQPRHRAPGTAVFGGTLVLEGDLVAQVTAPPSQGVLQRLVDAVVQAARQKGRYQCMADGVSAWVLPGVGILAVATFLLHYGSIGIPQALMRSLSVVLIACPCALGLATPLAIWAAMGRASLAGVLFRNPIALERLAAAGTILLDKTGTLTTGTAVLCERAYDSQTGEALVRRVALAAAASTTHVFAAALARELGGLGAAAPARVLFHRPGLGLCVAVEGLVAPAYLGSLRWLRGEGIEFPLPLRQAIVDSRRRGQGLILLAWGNRLRGVFTFDERLRPEAAAFVARCRALGLALQILSGDHARRTRCLGRQLGLPARGGLLPEDKLAVIQNCVRRERRRRRSVVMVGDGVNDAPSLAAADVGIALSAGADVSRDAADACLLSNNLAAIPWAIALARYARRIIRQNLAWAFAYNFAGVAAAMAGWLNPIVAALAMTVSSILVVANSLRLEAFPDCPPSPISMGPASGLPLADTAERVANPSTGPRAAHWRTA